MFHRSHTELFYHFVWATCNREKVISESWEKQLFDFIEDTCLKLRSPLIVVNGTENHIHVLLRASTMLSPAKIAHDIKGASSHMINREKLCRMHFVWQDGYGAFSVSTHDVDTITQYIQNQKKHHSGGTCKKEFEEDL